MDAIAKLLPTPKTKKLTTQTYFLQKKNLIFFYLTLEMQTILSKAFSKLLQHDIYQSVNINNFNQTLEVVDKT